MTDLITEKYLIKNLDCASCAAKIENGLKKVEGVDDAAVDFANLTLHVKAVDIERVLEAVDRIDPAVKLIPKDSNRTVQKLHEPSEDFKPIKELAILLAATTCFFLQLALAEWFQQLPFIGARFILILAAYFLAGWNVILGAFRTIRNRNFFDENVLMVIATVGAMAIQAYSEAIGVMIFYKIGEFLQELAVSRSRRSIKALLAAKPDFANLKTTDGIRKVPPEKVKVEDTIICKPGEKIPLDGEIVAGNAQLDTSSLTGESMPIAAGVGDAVMAGQINMADAVTVRVTRPFGESSIAKVLELVENASARKANTEKFITTFARYYTPAVVFIALCIALIPPLVIPGAGFHSWIYRALVLLVISCPCALVVSIPLGYFGGIGRASRNGILVKGSNYIDALSRTKTVVFDKTGTLTKGVFEVKEIVSQNGYSKDQLLELAAIAEQHSTHPIARSILAAYAKKFDPMDLDQIRSHAEIPGGGVRVQFGNRDVLVGNDKLLHLENIDHGNCILEDTVVNVAVDGLYAGYITFGDQIRPDAAEAISDLRVAGISKIFMLTGDNDCTAQHVASQLNLDGYYANLLPEDKVSVLDEISDGETHKTKIAFVGDGINDAPVIARADVGVAMGGLGSDAAIETADVVLMTDSPSKMAEAIQISNQTRVIVWQNIFLALSIKGVFVFLGALGVASMWAAVFADMGTALLAVLNSTRTLGKKRDKIDARFKAEPQSSGV
jgi:Cd2+/Zn2+-exporting ATPase